MTFALVIGLVVVFAVMFYRRAQFMSSSALKTGLRQLQSQAHDQPLHLGQHDLVQWSVDEAPHRRSFDDGLTCACWMVVDERANVEHVIVGTHAQGQKKLIQRMLLIMGELTAQFKEAGIQDKIKFHVEAQGQEAHKLSFTLSEAQHQAWVEALDDKV